MGLRVENINIMETHWKSKFLGENHKKPIYRGKLPKKSAYTASRFKRGEARQKIEGCYLRKRGG